MAKTFKDRKRQAQIDAGAYDGRYKTKIVEPLKRKIERKRKRIRPQDLEAEPEE